MRSSRMIVAGTVVAAAVASGTAMTAANVVPDSVAGYGEGMVTGVEVTDISYTPLAADNTQLASVEFTVDKDVTSAVAENKVTMTLKSGATLDADGKPTGGTPVGLSPYNCVVGTPWGGSSMTVVCATSDNPEFDDFTSVGLTVIA
jgi:hypothetical protein